MKLASHGTGGARRRMRYHSREHRALVYRGRAGDDGRTYVLRLNAGDVDALRAAGLTRTVAAVLDEGEGRGGNGQIPLLGSRDDAGPVPDELAADGFKACRRPARTRAAGRGRLQDSAVTGDRLRGRGPGSGEIRCSIGEIRHPFEVNGVRFAASRRPPPVPHARRHHTLRRRTALAPTPPDGQTPASARQ